MQACSHPDICQAHSQFPLHSRENSQAVEIHVKQTYFLVERDYAWMVDPKRPPESFPLFYIFTYFLIYEPIVH